MLAQVLELAAISAEKVHGTTATFRRGNAITLANLPIQLGTSSHEAQDSEGALLTFQSVDVLVRSAVLVNNTTPIVPQRGDQFVVGLTTYTVMDVPGFTAVRWSNSQRYQYRVHCKELA